MFFFPLSLTFGLFLIFILAGVHFIFLCTLKCYLQEQKFYIEPKLTCLYAPFHFSFCFRLYYPWSLFTPQSPWVVVPLSVTLGRALAFAFNIWRLQLFKSLEVPQRDDYSVFNNQEPSPDGKCLPSADKVVKYLGGVCSLPLLCNTAVLNVQSEKESSLQTVAVIVPSFHSVKLKSFCALIQS